MSFARNLRLAGLALAAAFALTAPPQARGADADVTELIGLFGAPCLERFPDDEAVRKYAEAKHLGALSAAEFQQMMKGDPGEGWRQPSGPAAHTLTLERPPFHTCAVRKQFSLLPDFRPALARRLSAWAATQPGAKLVELPPRTAPVGGVPSKAYLYDLAFADGKTHETLMAIVTPVDPHSRAEVRLVRAVGNR